MAYDILTMFDSVPGKRFEKTNGTGTGTLYVKWQRSEDGTFEKALIDAAQAPSTTDTFPVGSEWTYHSSSNTVATKYLKTGATTWTLMGSVA